MSLVSFNQSSLCYLNYAITHGRTFGPPAGDTPGARGHHQQGDVPCPAYHGVSPGLHQPHRQRAADQPGGGGVRAAFRRWGRPEVVLEPLLCCVRPGATRWTGAGAASGSCWRRGLRQTHRRPRSRGCKLTSRSCSTSCRNRCMPKRTPRQNKTPPMGVEPATLALGAAD